MTVDNEKWPGPSRVNRLCGSIAIVAFLLLMLSVSASAQSSAERIYVDQGCAVCHGLIGRGGVGPDFVGDHFLVLGDYVVAQILLGRGQMPGFSDKLSDDQIAAVASYVRQSWGNNIGALSPDEVKQIREKIGKIH